MFDIGWTEMLVVACVAILVVGPKDLPGMLRTFGKSISKVRSMAGDFQRQFSDALKEADLDEVTNFAKTAKAMNPLSDIEASVKELGAGMKLESEGDDSVEAEPPIKAAPAKPVKKKPLGAKANGAAAKTPAAKKPVTKKTVTKKTPAKKPVAKTAPRKSPVKAAASGAEKSSSKST